jgi:hypothetical protein
MAKRKSKVIAIGGVYPPAGHPEKDVVEILERCLARAKKGEVAGIAVAVVDGIGNIRSAYASGCADKNLMMASVHQLHTDITRIWYANFEEVVEKK